MTDLPPETVQDYPRPPALQPVTHRIRVMFGGRVFAETTHALRVLETHHAPTYYLPPEDVNAALTPAAGTSYCEWKGLARYFNVTAGGATALGAAWCYDLPTRGFAPLAGYLAFYAARMEACFVGDIRVTQQDGSYYGGWVTPNLSGRIKGAPGTEHW